MVSNRFLRVVQASRPALLSSHVSLDGGVVAALKLSARPSPNYKSKIMVISISLVLVWLERSYGLVGVGSQYEFRWAGLV
jgi:hypothetical protein